MSRLPSTCKTYKVALLNGRLYRNIARVGLYHSQQKYCTWWLICQRNHMWPTPWPLVHHSRTSIFPQYLHAFCVRSDNYIHQPGRTNNFHLFPMTVVRIFDIFNVFDKHHFPFQVFSYSIRSPRAQGTEIARSRHQHGSRPTF